jgi:hypothetical protein
MSGIELVSAGLRPAANGAGAYVPALEDVNASQAAMAAAVAYKVLVDALVAAGAVKADDLSMALSGAVDELVGSDLPGSAAVLDLYRKALG